MANQGCMSQRSFNREAPLVDNVLFVLCCWANYNLGHNWLDSININ